MQKKVIKYTLLILALFFLVYNSIYFRKLDEVKLASSSKTFDARVYATDFYTEHLIPHTDSAIDISQLISLLTTDPGNAFKTYSHALDIGNIRYFLIQGEGTISAVEEDAITLTLKNNSIKSKIKLATEFVYGNAIRDASGLINLNDFSNTADLNAVSEEINKIVRSEVLPSFKTNAKPGNEIKFSGAIELNQMHLSLDSIEIVPIRLSILKTS